MTVAIVTPFHHAKDPDRRDIMSRVFHHLAKIPDAVVIGVGSEREVSEELWCEHHKVSEYREYTQHWNRVGPGGSIGLREKFNVGIAATRDYDPDYVFICGSDDLVPVSFFTPSEADLVGPARGGPDGGIYFWKYGTDEAWWWAGFPFVKLIGGAQGFSRRLLDDLDWAPYRLPGDEVGMEQYVERSGYTIEARRGVASWAPKCDTVLNSFELVASVHELVPVSEESFAVFRNYWDTLA